MIGATLKDSMGDFGAEHRDKKDNPAYVTHMIAVSDLPDDYDPGRFFILYPGIFVSLNNYKSINFSGLHFHGGTPLRAPPDANPATLQWATQFCLIHYPPRGQTNSGQHYALGGLPGGKEVFFIPSEMMQAMYVTNFPSRLH